MNAVICCIAKCENRYIKEWVDYHLALGFSHIYIYDNNNVDGERFDGVLKGYEDIVSIIDCRGEGAYQSVAYTKFYKEYGDKCDWIAYIDIDEFITFSSESNIHSINEFLSRYPEDAQIVHLNWMCYGDNDVTDLDSFNVLQRFPKPLPFDKKVQYDFPENNHVKSVIRGKMNIGELTITVHTPRDGQFIVYDADGKPCVNDYFHPYTFNTAYIRHYVSKSIGEWLLKIYKGNVVATAFSELYPIERFFWYNERTEAKEKIIREFLFYKEAIEQSVATELCILRKEAIQREIDNEKLKNELHIARNTPWKRIRRFFRM